MAAKFVENYYSVRDSTSLIDTAIVGSNPETTTLASIESTLASANTAFLARQYQTAINDYQEAAGQIYSLIDPSFLTLGGRGFRLPTDTGLVAPSSRRILNFRNSLKRSETYFHFRDGTTGTNATGSFIPGERYLPRMSLARKSDRQTDSGRSE
jgi:hypothetical protein